MISQDLKKILPLYFTIFSTAVVVFNIFSDLFCIETIRQSIESQNNLIGGSLDIVYSDQLIESYETQKKFFGEELVFKCLFLKVDCSESSLIDTIYSNCKTDLLNAPPYPTNYSATSINFDLVCNSNVFLLPLYSANDLGFKDQKKTNLGSEQQFETDLAKGSDGIAFDTLNKKIFKTGRLTQSECLLNCQLTNYKTTCTTPKYISIILLSILVFTLAMLLLLIIGSYYSNRLKAISHFISYHIDLSDFYFWRFCDELTGAPLKIEQGSTVFILSEEECDNVKKINVNIQDRIIKFKDLLYDLQKSKRTIKLTNLKSVTHIDYEFLNDDQYRLACLVLQSAYDNPKKRVVHATHNTIYDHVLTFDEIFNKIIKGSFIKEIELTSDVVLLNNTRE